MPLTPDHKLDAQIERIKSSVGCSRYFKLKSGWSVSYDSAHIELIKEGPESFDELLSLLKVNDYLRTITIWIKGGKLVKTTKHKRRLFWFGGDCISKQKAREILESSKIRSSSSSRN